MGRSLAGNQRSLKVIFLFKKIRSLKILTAADFLAAVHFALAWVATGWTVFAAGAGN